MGISWGGNELSSHMSSKHRHFDLWLQKIDRASKDKREETMRATSALGIFSRLLIGKRERW